MTQQQQQQQQQQQFSGRGYPGGSVLKKLPANAGDEGLISGLGRSPRGGNGNPLQYSCPEVPRTKEPSRL